MLSQVEAVGSQEVTAGGCTSRIQEIRCVGEKRARKGKQRNRGEEEEEGRGGGGRRGGDPGRGQSEEVGGGCSLKHGETSLLWEVVAVGMARHHCDSSGTSLSWQRTVSHEMLVVLMDGPRRIPGWENTRRSEAEPVDTGIPEGRRELCSFSGSRLCCYENYSQKKKENYSHHFFSF